MVILLRFSFALLFAATGTSASSSSSLRNLAAPSDESDTLPPLAIKGIVHMNDDPHVIKEKRDLYNNVITPRIVGGRDVVVGEYPFFVRVDHNFFPTCGGTLVAPDVVLTAGHCLNEERTITVIVNGYLDGPVMNLPDQHPRAVAEMVRHEDYHTEKYYNDMMLMRLEEPVYDVPYVELNTDPDEPKMGDTVTAMGLGALDETGGYPSLLQTVDLGIVDYETCNAVYSGVGLGPILDDIMVCAGSITNKPQDSCQGDSGGPLLLDGVQVGVISFGLGCAREGVPGVYCRTAVRGDKRDWLGETLCDMTRTNDLDEWCGRSVSFAIAEGESTPMPSTEATEELTDEPTSALSVEAATEEPTSRPSVESSTSDDPERGNTPMPSVEATKEPTEEPTSAPSVEIVTEEQTSRPSVEHAASEPTLPSSVESVTPEPTATQAQVETVEGKTDAEAGDEVEVDLCVDDSDIIFQLMDKDRDCRWLRCAHEAIQQSACVEGSDAWKVCRATCGRCPDS